MQIAPQDQYKYDKVLDQTLARALTGKVRRLDYLGATTEVDVRVLDTGQRIVIYLVKMHRLLRVQGFDKSLYCDFAVHGTTYHNDHSASYHLFIEGPDNLPFNGAVAMGLVKQYDKLMEAWPVACEFLADATVSLL